MRIESVRINNRKKSFELRAEGRTFSYPFAELDLVPERTDRVKEAAADPELGSEAFTYRLESGREDTIHLDRVLEYNRDPEYWLEILLHKLTLEVISAVDESPLSRRELIRRLNTSASQFYRLIDPANTSKSVRQMISLLILTGRDVEVLVRTATSGDVRPVSCSTAAG